MSKRQNTHDSHTFESGHDPERLKPWHLIIFGLVSTVALVASLALMATLLIQSGNDRRASWQLRDLQDKHALLEEDRSSLKAQLVEAEQRNAKLAHFQARVESTAESLTAAKATISAKQRELDDLNRPAGQLQKMAQTDLLKRYDRFRIMPVIDAESQALGLREGPVKSQAEIAVRSAGFVLSEQSSSVIIVWVDTISVSGFGVTSDRDFAVVRASLTVPLRVSRSSFAAFGEVLFSGRLIALGKDHDESTQLLDTVSDVVDELVGDIREAHETP